MTDKFNEAERRAEEEQARRASQRTTFRVEVIHEFILEAESTDEALLLGNHLTTRTDPEPPFPCIQTAKQCRIVARMDERVERTT